VVESLSARFDGHDIAERAFLEEFHDQRPIATNVVGYEDFGHEFVRATRMILHTCSTREFRQFGQAKR